MHRGPLTPSPVHITLVPALTALVLPIRSDLPRSSIVLGSSRLIGIALGAAGHFSVVAAGNVAWTMSVLARDETLKHAMLAEGVAPAIATILAE